MNAVPIHLVQVDIDVPRAVRHLRPYLSATALRDDSLLLKTILTEGFGGPVVRPWAVHTQRGAKTLVVGYSKAGADDLQRRRGLAMPGVQMALGEPITATMPAIRKGDLFRFSVRLVPTLHVTAGKERRHGERDAFLAAVDKGDAPAGLNREAVYRTYLEERVAGATIQTCRMDQFQLKKFARPRAKGEFSGKGAPEATLSGSLFVDDPQTFEGLLLRGVGRHKAYGYGMMRLQPTRA